MQKKLIKPLVISMVISLVLLLVGSFALARGEELTPYEWSKLSNKDKLEYKTIVIRVSGGDWMEEETRKNFNQIMHLGDTNTTTAMHSKALFEYLHPKVKIVNISFDASDVKRLTSAIAGGTAPCIYNRFSGFEEAGLAADITDLVENWDQTPYLKERSWTLWKTCWRDNRCYGVITDYVSEQLMTFRKDWFKEAGIFNEKGEPRPPDNWSWDDLRDICVKLTDVKKKRWGLAFVGTAAWGGQFALTTIANGAFGAFVPPHWVTPDKSGKYTWQVTPTPQQVKALQFFRDLRFKYNCMLTGIELGYHECYREVKAGRAGMNWYTVTDVLRDIITTPYCIDPAVPMKDIVGVALTPMGPHKIRMPRMSGMWFSFDPTLSKEQLKAAFEWWDWNHVGMGRELQLRQIADMFRFTPFSVDKIPWTLIIEPYWSYEFRGETPVGLPDMKKYIPSEYYEVHEKELRTPTIPEPVDFGLELGLRTYDREEIAALVSLIQSVVTNPNTTVEAEMKKTADILNKTVFNYKIKGDKEKMKNFVDAMIKFYKENYPEYYDSKEFEEELEYFKIW